MATAPAARRTPYRPPPPGAPLRLAFVGQSTFFRACALEDGPGVRTTFVEFRKDGDAERMRTSVEAFAPHAVVVFRPEVVPEGLFAPLRVPVLGFLTEPLPRTFSGGKVDEDLRLRLWELEHADPANFDRVVSFDPYIAETATAAVPVWRSLPLPVADRYYGPVAPMRSPPRALFVGKSTEHREWMLRLAKHDFDLVHYAFGVDADDLAALLREHEVGVNLHNQRYLSFENRICLHLAAGHLVFSEALSPTHGLEHGLDFIEIESPDNLHWQLEQLSRFPRLYHPVRVRGRRKAEQFRASRVYPRLIADLFADLAAFGSPRSPA